MAQHLAKPGVFSQGLEVVRTIAADGLQYHKAFDIGGFIETASSLLDGDVTPHVTGHVQAAQGTHQQRYAA